MRSNATRLLCRCVEKEKALTIQALARVFGDARIVERDGKFEVWADPSTAITIDKSAHLTGAYNGTQRKSQGEFCLLD